MNKNALKGIGYLEGMAKEFDDEYALEAIYHIRNYVKQNNKAITKLERLEIEHRALNTAHDITNILNEPKLTKLERIEAIDLDEVQICLNSLDTMAEYNYGYDEKIYFEIQNLIDTLRGVKDE